jgi:CheY-like chemotaxis protein
MTQEALDRRSKTILGIDDSWEMQAIVHATVTKAGYHFVAAEDSAEAMAIIAARESFAVMLLDVQLPDMDGYELCRKIRRTPKGMRAPIIFLTVNNTLGDLEKCQSAGGNGFIVKPVSARELLRHVDYWAVRHIAPQRT